MIAYTFVMMNWAAVLGLYHFLCGHTDIWDRHRILQGVEPLGERN